MASNIDPTNPTSGSASTLSVRLNFAHAKAEIEALQAQVAAIVGTLEPAMDQVPLPFAAGDGAASALLDISDAAGELCVIASEGPIKVRFGHTLVTASTFHLALQAGTSSPFTVPATVTEMSAWGDGGAWKFNLVRVN